MRERLDSVRQLFEFLNDVNFVYVVLRNWENLPDNAVVGQHSDLDLLVYDRAHFLELFPFAKAEYPFPRVRYRIPVKDTHLYADIREVGDGYYPVELATRILNEREFNPMGFFTPSPQLFRIALAYHAVHHKNFNNYQRYLGDATVDQLKEALRAANVGWDEPTDPTVGRFHAYAAGATSIVERREGFVLKKQRAYMDRDLIANEERCLMEHTSSHFPRILGREDGMLRIEDCGEPITVSNLPEDWKPQLLMILLDLEAHEIEHRDIKPDNLTVKDGVIKLIDFGWARKLSDPVDVVPSCLGVPYRPSWGPDDNFAMKKVIREFEYQREEILV